MSRREGEAERRELQVRTRYVYRLSFYNYILSRHETGRSGVEHEHERTHPLSQHRTPSALTRADEVEGRRSTLLVPLRGLPRMYSSSRSRSLEPMCCIVLTIESHTHIVHSP